MNSLMREAAIERAALGHTASLGELYDARNDTFCRSSIFKNRIPEDAIILTDSQGSEVNHVHTECMGERFAKLNVNPDLQLSLLANLVGAGGSAAFLEGQGLKESAREVKKSLIYKISTVNQVVDFCLPDIKNGIDMDVLNSGVATHVVCGISWGGSLVLSCSSKNRGNDDDLTKLEGFLSAQMKKLELAILNMEPIDLEALDEFQIQIFSDGKLILPEMELITLDGALKFIKQFQGLATTSNQGKGLPVTYHLLPIPVLKMSLVGSVPTTSTISFEKASVAKVVALFDEMFAVQQELNDLFQDSVDFQYCVPLQKLDAMEKLREDVEAEVTSWRVKLAEVVSRVRFGDDDVDVSELDDIVRSLRSNEISPQAVMTSIKNWNDIALKIKFAQALIQSGASYVGRGASFDVEIQRDPNAKTAALYFSSASKSFRNVSTWRANRDLFFHKMKDNAEYDRFFAVDCDIHPSLMPKGCSSCIQVIQRGRLIVADLLQSEPEASRFTTSTSQSELNILIMGETGVGKSTWINGFINFLKYESLAEAEQGEVYTFIPSKFMVYNSQLQNIVVCTGTDNNEQMENVDQSATQESKVYPFQIGETLIRLIDTPGIGDTRGILKDKENFQNILSTLSNFKELHGICILLKPNNARLTLMFRFCVKELLTYLHRDASKNIMFCFTNTRGTFYRPGDTLPALQALLLENQDVEIVISPETVYCYDSEAYRFLAAVKNQPPVIFPEGERENFAKSWDYSIAETERMLKYIKGLKAHPVQSTLNLNHARELVLKLVRPLAEITRNIQTNKAIVTDELKGLENTRASIEDLKRRMMTTRTEIEVRPIGYPKTVCGNKDCVRVWALDNNTATLEYAQECHPQCYLRNVKQDTVGDPELMKCWAMAGTNVCRHANCGHSYREHLHVYYDSIQVSKEVVNESVKEALQDKRSAEELKRKLIAAKTMEQQQYAHELKAIQGASVQFACFLKSNAITPYNDAMEQYVKHLITEEENKVGRGGNKATLDALRISLESYLQEKEILETEMKRGERSALLLSPQEIDSLVDNLKRLKFSGPTLKRSLECIDYAKNAMYHEIRVQRPRMTVDNFERRKPKRESSYLRTGYNKVVWFAQRIWRN